MTRKPDAAAFFTPDQDLFFEHQFTNVLESDRTLIKLQSELLSDTGDQKTLGIGSGNCPAPAFGSVNVKEQQRQYLQRIYVLSVFVNDAEAVRITVSGKSHVASRGSYRLAEGFQLRHHRLRMDSTEKRIRISTNGSNSARGVAKEFFKDIAATTVQGINNDLQFGFSNSVPIQKRLHVFKVVPLRTGYLQLGRRCDPCVKNRRSHRRYSLLDSCGNRRSRASPKMCFDFKAVKGGGVMARGDHDTAHEFPATNFKRDVGCRVRPVQQHDAKIVGCDHFGGRLRECFRLESHVESDENSTFTTLDGLEIFCCGLRCSSDVLKRKSVRNDGPPSIGSEFNGTLHNEEKSVTTLLSPSTTPERRFADRPI